jgi:outer membrane protein OmpA-like peptidoglycan-associated protein
MSESLRIGDQGLEVAQLQEYLTGLGYSDAVAATAWVFDDHTERALLAFQRDYGIPETGELDEYTWRTMAALPLAAQPPVPPDASWAPEPGWQPETYPASASEDVPEFLQPADLHELEDDAGTTERTFDPDGEVALRVDPTHYVFWGFDLGSAELRPDYGVLLDEIAEYLLAVDTLAYADVVGHTSSSGSQARNVTISETRAASIRDALEERGVASERIRWWGEGEARLWMDDGDGPAAMARNRRVEVIITPVAAGAGHHEPADAPEPAEPAEPAGPDGGGPDGGSPPPVEWPPREWVRIIITDPPPDLPEAHREILDRIREILDGLPEDLAELLEFDFEAGALLISGVALATIAALVAMGQKGLAILAIKGIGPGLAVTVMGSYSELSDLESALLDLADLSRPPEVPVDAGADIPAGVPEPDGGVPDAGSPDAGPPDGGSPDGGDGPRRVVRGFHGADGDAILGILDSGVTYPSGGQIWLNQGDHRDSYMHGGDRRRRASFVADLEISYQHERVTEERQPTQGVVNTLLLRTEEALETTVLRVFRRTRSDDGEWDEDVLTGAAEIVAALR